MEILPLQKSVITLVKQLFEMLSFYGSFMLILLLFALDNVKAQEGKEPLGYYQDALHFSEFGLHGSAKTQALAGAQTALGGDLGSIYSNPGGVALFQKSTLSVSPSLDLLITNAEFQNNSTSDGKFNPSINSMGLVLSFIKDSFEKGIWRGGDFSISFTRLNSFQNRFTYQGENSQNSLTNSFIESVNGTPVEELEAELNQIETLEALAYFTFLINPVGDSLNSYFDFTNNKHLKQEETINRRGSRNIWNFAYGGNIANRFYFGVGVGVDVIQYEAENKYQETVLGNQSKNLKDFTLNDRVTVQGTGINFALGLIVRPLSFLRLGASFTSPTYYSLQEDFATSIIANYDNFVITNEDTLRQEIAETLPNSFQYRLLNPWRASAGIAIFIGKSGFLTGDVEYIAYDKLQLSGKNKANFQVDNEYIANLYQPTFNYRVGGEAHFNTFRIRGGYAWQQSPIKTGSGYLDTDLSRQYITTGLGFLSPNYFFDFALIHNTFKKIEFPYTLSDNSQPQVTITHNFWRTVITFGYYF